MYSYTGAKLSSESALHSDLMHSFSDINGNKWAPVDKFPLHDLLWELRMFAYLVENLNVIVQ